MKIFISGGCKNGKSYHAQHMAKAQKADHLYYVATMKPVDKEDDIRIKRHQDEREGWGFITVEQPVNIAEILDKCSQDGSFLLDSLTALLANEMFLPDGSINDKATDQIITGLGLVLTGINNIVIVSDYIYSDAMIYDPLTEKYRKALADIDREAAWLCDTVLEVSYTNVIAHKADPAYLGVKFSELY